MNNAMASDLPPAAEQIIVLISLAHVNCHGPRAIEDRYIA
jgi:hypothetical protein